MFAVPKLQRRLTTRLTNKTILQIHKRSEINENSGRLAEQKLTDTSTVESYDEISELFEMKPGVRRGENSIDFN